MDQFQFELVVHKTKIPLIIILTKFSGIKSLGSSLETHSTLFQFPLATEQTTEILFMFPKVHFLYSDFRESLATYKLSIMI